MCNRRRWKIKKERLRVLNKITDLGYDTDKKILNIKIEDLVLNNDISKSDLTIVVGIKKSLLNKSLVTFLCATEEGEK